jgi:hypothetical protein
MAINEKRTFFPVLKWNANPKVRQVWFAGVHSDVGGGYKNKGLSDTALKWMIDSVHKHGLPFKASAVKALAKAVDGKLHESYQGVWLPFGTRARTIDPADLVHQSVKELRAKWYADPGNLPPTPNYVPT